MSGSAYWDATWTCIEGCTKCSPGCANCFALAYARRYTGYPPSPCYGLVKNGEWTGEVRCREDKLTVPLRWKDPRVIFVNIRSDTFHPDVPFDFIHSMHAIMSLCPQHTFIICTKRAERMAEFYCKDYGPYKFECDHTDAGFWVEQAMYGGVTGKRLPERADQQRLHLLTGDNWHWPLPNVWLGVTVENQAAADERIPHLLRCPAAVRWVSAEPLLGGINLLPWIAELRCENHCAWHGYEDELESDDSGGEPRCPQCESNSAVVDNWDYRGDTRRPPIDWLATGGETGPGARPCDVEHIRSVVEQCKAANVPVWVKQMGSQSCDALTHAESKCRGGFKRATPTGRGDDMNEWPEDLQVRERPEVTRG